MSETYFSEWKPSNTTSTKQEVEKALLGPLASMALPSALGGLLTKIGLRTLGGSVASGGFTAAPIESRVIGGTLAGGVGAVGYGEDPAQGAAIQGALSAIPMERILRRIVGASPTEHIQNELQYFRPSTEASVSVSPSGKVFVSKGGSSTKSPLEMLSTKQRQVEPLGTGYTHGHKHKLGDNPGFSAEDLSTISSHPTGDEWQVYNRFATDGISTNKPITHVPNMTDKEALQVGSFKEEPPILEDKLYPPSIEHTGSMQGRNILSSSLDELTKSLRSKTDNPSIKQYIDRNIRNFMLRDYMTDRDPTKASFIHNLGANRPQGVDVNKTREVLGDHEAERLQNYLENGYLQPFKAGNLSTYSWAQKSDPYVSKLPPDEVLYRIEPSGVFSQTKLDHLVEVLPTLIEQGKFPGGIERVSVQDMMEHVRQLDEERIAKGLNIDAEKLAKGIAKWGGKGVEPVGVFGDHSVDRMTTPGRLSWESEIAGSTWCTESKEVAKDYLKSSHIYLVRNSNGVGRVLIEYDPKTNTVNQIRNRTQSGAVPKEDLQATVDFLNKLNPEKIAAKEIDSLGDMAPLFLDKSI